MTDNLWTNPSFEDGWHHAPYNIAEIQIPDGCEFEFYTGLPNDEDPAHTPFAQPESNVKPRAQIPENEQDLFFLDGNWTYKVFGAGRPIHFLLRQHKQLIAGTHSMVVPIFSDLYNAVDEHGNKIGAADPKSGQVRCVVNGYPSAWQYFGGENVLKLANYIFDFTVHSTGAYDVAVEFKLPHPLKSNGIFTDGWSLVRIADATDCKGLPRIQYDRLYILLPQGLDAEWWQAAVIGSRGFEVTVGSAADDAGIGALDSKSVIVVNKDQIGTGISQAWFDEHYPGTKIAKAISAADPATLRRRLRNYFVPPDPKPPDPKPPDPDPKTYAIPTLHLQTEVDGWIEFIDILCQRGKPPGAVKFVGGFESARKVKAIAANYGVDILTIGRFYDANQGKWLGTSDPAAAAKAYTDQFADAVVPAQIDVVSSLNETVATDNLKTITDQVAFDVAFAKHVRQRWGGEVSAVLLEIAVGNPREGQQTDMLRPAAVAALEASVGARLPFYLGYHSYWWGAPLAQYFAQAGITRYRRIAGAQAVTDPVIVQPNVLRALREGDNDRAAEWTRRFFNAEHFPGGVVTPAAAGSIQYESGLESWWEWHAGRAVVHWKASFDAVGLDPWLLMTEIGVVGTPDRGPTLFASAGWRDSICYGANWPLYEADILRWQELMAPYKVRAGTIFTIGDRFVGWDKFKLVKDQMVRLAQVL